MTQMTPRKRGRPKSAPEASETRRRLMRAGLIHLTERGYTGSGIDDILRQAGVPKGSFYHHFASKADFGAALIDAYHHYFMGLLGRAFDAPDLAPLDRLRRFTEDAEAGMARHEFRRGCLIGNLGQEMGALPDAFRARLIAVLDAWQDRTVPVLRAAASSGALRPGLDPEALAVTFWTGWEGAVLRAKLERSPAPLRSFAHSFFTLITA